MIDTHAHLDACADPPGDLVSRARAVGVSTIVTIGSGIESSRAALALCDRHDGVFAALGVHPHQAGDTTAEDVGRLRALLEHPRAVAVGETGLDYFRDYARPERQRAMFTLQMELAAELRKPLVIHTRTADDETMAALEGYPADLPVVLHCFSSPALLTEAVARRYYVSFAGNVTFPKAVDLRLVASQVPDDRLLAETDSPYLAPQAVRGRPNEPAHVVHVLETLADVRGTTREALERRIEQNASRAFSLP